ncbi:MAG TPA: hypothetical protein VNO70_19500 [Blastocatellia bacterium]|nr:hypothetical protein [Blastocatellia bacterium]
MSSNRSAVFSIVEIKRIYPEEWVAVAIAETDADGLPAMGAVLVHGRDERFVWSAAKLGEMDELIYVFHTGARLAA